MRRQSMLFLLVFLFSIFIFSMFYGCCEECEECQECPECADTNYTHIDPPYIQNITAPEELVVGNSGDFSYEVLSDTGIVRSSWIFFANSEENSDFFYPEEGSYEGEWVPDEDIPDMFENADTGVSVSHLYSHRGIFTATLEIEDADGYVERDGRIVNVLPAEPDTDESPILLAPGLTDTAFGEDFTLLDYGLWATGGCLASVWEDSFPVLRNFCFVDSLSGVGEKYVYSWIECGKILRVAGSKSNLATISVNFDIAGALHIWDAAETDYVQYSVYLSTRMIDGGLPETHYIYSKSLEGIDGDQSYYLNSNHTKILEINFAGDEEYEIYFGVKVKALISDGGGAAICFDNDELGFTGLNYMILSLPK